METGTAFTKPEPVQSAPDICLVHSANSGLLQRLQQGSDAYAVCNDIVQFGDGYAFLLHGVAVAQRHAVVFQCLVVYGHAERCADGILTAVALADAVFL